MLEKISVMMLWLILMFVGQTTVAQHSHSTNETEIGVWKIKHGEVLADSSNSTNHALAKQYWDKVLEILPDTVMNQFVVSLRLFTDGKHEALAGMRSLDSLNQQWEIDIDTADMNLANQDSTYILGYTHTLIHEFGHLITLNGQQICADYQGVEDYYAVAEGAALPNSYLYQFVYAFWDDKMLSKWDRIDWIPNEKRRLKALYRFYLKHYDEFVTDYAAESPTEDIAEAWAFFVLSDEQTYKSVLYHKVLFFYQYPELVAYRTIIRSKLKQKPFKYIRNFRYPTY